METHEYAPNRTILAPNGEEYQVADTITGGSGNDWLIVTQDRDLGTATLVLSGHIRDTWFPVEPEEPVDTSPTAQAQADAERLRNEKKKAKAEKKARKAAESKKGKKSAKKSPVKKSATAPKTTAKAKAKDNTMAAPGPAAVSTL